MQKSILTAVTIFFLACSGNAFAAKGGVCKDGSLPPCNPSGGGEEPTAVNHLSYPAALVPATTSQPLYFTTADEIFGTTYSFGCDQPQEVIVNGTKFSYPNTTCAVLDPLTGVALEYLDAAACTDPGDPALGTLPGPCAGLPVQRIYWQKTSNDWSAEATAFSANLPLTARYLDWGDSIESVTWNENSILRVETQPFIDLATDLRDEITAIPPAQEGFQMWHVEGQGTTEQWGVRADDAQTPYIYSTPYAIINAGTAQLFLSKLGKESAAAMGGCPAAGESTSGYPEATYFDRGWLGTGWENSCNFPVVPYTLELSVSGKYVHGYNWRMSALTNPLPLATCGDATWDKTGWWRLTFVPNGGRIGFASDTVTTAPPVFPGVPTQVGILSEEEESEALYAPVVDPLNNLSYIDICIAAKTNGGGGKRR